MSELQENLELALDSVARRSASVIQTLYSQWNAIQWILTRKLLSRYQWVEPKAMRINMRIFPAQSLRNFTFPRHPIQMASI